MNDTRRVEVDVADLIALREWKKTGYLTVRGWSHEALATVERLVAAIPPPRLVPTRDAVEKALYITGHVVFDTDEKVGWLLASMHDAGLLRDDCMEPEA